MHSVKTICIIVPAFNEARSLPAVLEQIKAYCPQAKVAVVNDASKDQTSRVAHESKVIVLDCPINQGIGGAVQTGLKFASRSGFDIAMQVDGDGQHDPQFISLLLRQIVQNKADMIIGSRFLDERGYKTTRTRMIGIRLFSYFIGIATNRRISDPTSGFRAYNKEALAFAAEHYPTDFPEPESIVLMLRNGFSIKEVPVVMKERQGGVSSVRPLKAAYFVVSNIIAIMVGAIKAKKR